MITFVKIATGAFVSLVTGGIWYSELAFGRTWWRHTFPGKPYGQLGNASKPLCSPMLLCVISCLTQSILLTSLISFFKASTHGIPFMMVPFYCLPFLMIMIICSIIPHAAHSCMPFPLFLVTRGYDIVQLALSFGAIFLLSCFC